MGWIWTRFGIARKRDGNRLCRFPFFVWSKMEEKKEKRRKKKEERKKNEDGSVLAGQAGMEVVGWREVVRPPV